MTLDGLRRVQVCVLFSLFLKPVWATWLYFDVAFHDFHIFRWKPYKAYRRGRVFLTFLNTTWVETTPLLTRLPGNSTEKGWSSLLTLEVTMSKRGPHGVGHQRPPCSAAPTLPTLYQLTAARRSSPIPLTEHPQHLPQPKISWGGTTLNTQVPPFFKECCYALGI